MKLYVGIINHNENKKAISLADRFREVCQVFLIDSGSNISVKEKSHFDLLLPNVFYSGLLNGVFSKLTDTSEDDAILFVASDVGIFDHTELYQSALQAFTNPRIGLYAPSVRKGGSNQRQMINKGNDQLRQAIFVDGFCFASRIKFLNQLCPIDLNVNKIGWGIDSFLSFLALQDGCISVVDDRVTVEHKPGPNNIANPKEYITEAKLERKNFYESKNWQANLFLRYSSIEFVKNQIGAKVGEWLFGK